MINIVGYRPDSWFWVVNGDDSRAWSSESCSWVTSWDPARVTRINSEEDLNWVLGAIGRRGPHVTADMIRAEAQKRIIGLLGARDLNGCLTKQLNALMRATELANKRAIGNDLTSDEAAEAEHLEAMASAVKAIRAASNAMEPNPPQDYTSDKHWP